MNKRMATFSLSPDKMKLLSNMHVQMSGVLGENSGTAGSCKQRLANPLRVSTLARAGVTGHDTSLFFRLVLVCIETKFRNQIRIFQHFPTSTKLSSWIFKILQNFAKNQRFLAKIRKFSKKLQKFAKNLWKFAKFHKILYIFWKFS